MATDSKRRENALQDRKDIEDVLVRFARSIDSRDWATYRAQFSSEVEADYRSLIGGEVLNLSADEWAARAERSFAGFQATQHFVSNFESGVDGDRGTCDAYVCAQHIASVEGEMVHWVMGGAYRSRLSRRASRWTIDALSLDVLWSLGEEGIFEHAARAAESASRSRGDDESASALGGPR